MTKYKWRVRPYRHQVAAVKATLRKLYETGGYALLMEPRTGKTKVAIDTAAIMHRKGDVQRVLVICPINAMDVWISEIRKNCPYRFRITVWDKRGRKVFNLPAWNSILDFVIINYDAFGTPGRIRHRDDKGNIIRSRSRGGRYDMRREVRKWQPHLVVLDESHRIKTPSSKRTRTIWGIGWQDKLKPRPHSIPLVPYRLILTGTVMTKKKRIFDIYSQWQFVNRQSPLVKGKTLADFKNEFSVWTERRGYPQWLRNRPGAERRLRALLHRESFAVARSECYDLPARFNPVLIKVPLEESAKYYDEMAEEMVAKISEGEFTWAKIPLVQRLRLSQLTSGIAKTEPTPQYPEGRLVRIGKEKLKYLEDFLYDQFEAGEKVVIGAQFRGDISAIVALIRKLRVPCFEIHGGISRPERTMGIARFAQVEGAAAMICQPSAASEAIDLSSAATVVWYSLTDSWVHFQQFEDRIALSSRATRYVYLIAENTVDEIKYQSLMDDGDIARRITESPQLLLRNFKQ